MNSYIKTLFILLALAPAAHAENGFDFNFIIKGDHFSLTIKEEFKTPLSELRKNFAPGFLPQISNVVRSAEVSVLRDSVSEISITSKKHGISSTIASICAEKTTDTEWDSDCTLDLNAGDTGDYFNSGTESIRCLTTSIGATCTFVVEASVKPQKVLIIHRSSEVLALGGIVERIHDQGVLSRVVNLKESPGTAMENFSQSSIGTCLDQIYSNYQKSAQKQAFSSSPLTVQADAWHCSP